MEKQDLIEMDDVEFIDLGEASEKTESGSGSHTEVGSAST